MKGGLLASRSVGYANNTASCGERAFKKYGPSLKRKTELDTSVRKIKRPTRKNSSHAAAIFFGASLLELLIFVILLVGRFFLERKIGIKLNSI